MRESQAVHKMWNNTQNSDVDFAIEQRDRLEGDAGGDDLERINIVRT
jgi:hypothetical protein